MDDTSPLIIESSDAWAVYKPTIANDSDAEAFLTAVANFVSGLTNGAMAALRATTSSANAVLRSGVKSETAILTITSMLRTTSIDP